MTRWIEAKVIFDLPCHSQIWEQEETTDLISNIFYDLGLQGVAVETRDVDTTEDWAEDAPVISDYNAVKIGRAHV